MPELPPPIVVTDDWLAEQGVERSVKYPPFAVTEDDRRRWDLSSALANKLFEGDGELAIALATRAIYDTPFPTDDRHRPADPSRPDVSSAGEG
jgi:hypothetical protein